MRILAAIIGAVIDGARDGASAPRERDEPRAYPLVGMRYRPYPYAEGGYGDVFWLRDKPTPEDFDYQVIPAIQPRGKRWSFQVGLEGAFLPTNIARGGLNSRLMIGLFEINTSWSYFHEFDIHDHLVMGDAKLGLSVGAPGVHLHLGTGPSVMIDPGVVEASQAATIGYSVASGWLEVHPLKPLTIGVGGEAGLMPGALYWRARGTAGVSIRRVELFAGYEHLQVGTVRLGGPMLGVIVRI